MTPRALVEGTSVLVSSRVAAFLESRAYFSLSDLQNLPIPSADGGRTPLRSFGSVDVWFTRARTEIVVSDDGSNSIWRVSYVGNSGARSVER